MTELKHRLEHWTFVVGTECHVCLERPKGLDRAAQPAALREQLQALQHFRWRRTSQHSQLVASLRGWCLTPALIAELRGLPHFGFDMCLNFAVCEWLATESTSYQSLPSTVPSSYSTWEFAPGQCNAQHPCKAKHIQHICMGVPARGQGAAKLVLRLFGDYQTFTDKERSRIEAWIENHGFDKYIADVEWCLEW